MQVASVITSRQTQLRLRIRCLASSNYYCAYRHTGQKTRNTRCRSSRRRLACIKITGARETDARRIDQARRKHMCFLQAKHLLAEVQEIGEKCIERSGRYAAAVVDGIDRRRRILRRKDVVETGCSEVLMNRLH